MFREKNSDDKEIVKNGARFIVDELSLQFIQGSTIDFTHVILSSKA